MIEQVYIILTEIGIFGLMASVIIWFMRQQFTELKQERQAQADATRSLSDSVNTLALSVTALAAKVDSEVTNMKNHISRLEKGHEQQQSEIMQLIRQKTTD